jgi:hypothetical protein
LVEVVFAYSNFRIPALVDPSESPKPDEPGLVAQAAGHSLLLPSHDDGSVPDHSWRITDMQRAEVRRLYATGLSITKIANLTGMAWSTARLILDSRA